MPTEPTPVYGPLQATPEPGTLVVYHGSLTNHHGVWQVLCDYRGAAVLVDPANPNVTMTVSAGNRTITVLIPNASIVATVDQLMDEIAEALGGDVR